MTDIYADNPSARSIINHKIIQANKHFSPSLNQETEALSGEPSDREASDYAGCDREITE
jgi:hypothetical protein